MGVLREKVVKPLKEILSSSVSRLILVLILYVLSALSILAPFLPILLANYFATVRSGSEVDCTGADSTIDVCRHATNDVVIWRAGATLVTNLGFGIFLYPSLGTWSDIIGRKPFILLGCMMALLPPLVVLCNVQFGLPLWWYFPAFVLSQALNPFVPSLAHVADATSPSNRTIAFALLGCVFGIAFIIGPILGGTGVISGPLVASIVAMGCAVLCSLSIIVFLPESLSRSNAALAKSTLESNLENKGWWHQLVKRPITMFWSSFSILFRSPLFIQLTVCIFVVYVNFGEVYDLESQYFREVAGFNAGDIGNLLAIAGTAGLLTISVVLWGLLSVFHMNDKQILLFGMVMFGLQQLAYAFVRSKALIYTATAIGTTANLVLPAINSIKSRIVTPQEQGALQGAIQSCQSIARGLGPVVFVLFFVGFRNKSMYFPGAPFLFGAVLLLVGIVIGCRLRLPDNDNSDMEQQTARPKQTELKDTAPLLKSFRLPMTALADTDDEDNH